MAQIEVVALCRTRQKISKHHSLRTLLSVQNFYDVARAELRVHLGRISLQKFKPNNNLINSAQMASRVAVAVLESSAQTSVQ